MRGIKLKIYKNLFFYISFSIGNILMIRPWFDSNHYWQIRFAILGFTFDIEYHD